MSDTGPDLTAAPPPGVCGGEASRAHRNPRHRLWRGRPLLALAPAVVLLTATGATAATGTSTIGTPHGQCLTAQGGHTTDGTPVVLAPCRNRPAQQWVITPPTGAPQTWQLNGTQEYVTVLASSDPPQLALGPAQYAAQTWYVNHALAMDGDWLARSNGVPYLQPGWPGQAWYEFTTLKPGT